MQADIAITINPGVAKIPQNSRDSFHFFLESSCRFSSFFVHFDHQSRFFSFNSLLSTEQNWYFVALSVYFNYTDFGGLDCLMSELLYQLFLLRGDF